MDGAEATLYPRHLLNSLPKEGRPVCIVGQVIDVSDNNTLTLDCDPDSTHALTQTSSRSWWKFPAT